MQELKSYVISPQAPSADKDPTAASRKADHIQLAFEAQTQELDRRFYYEPLLAPHPAAGSLPSTSFVDKRLAAPIWVSSMTGGTEKAKRINQNLAKACREFGLGMGLGSCRPLLYSDDRLADFAIRPLIGDDQPLYANLGIAQLEELQTNKEGWRLQALLDKIDADGLIVHVNPFQEWLQPEGDRFQKAPLETITWTLEQTSAPIIVKEVGQGMGIDSLRQLLQLPIAAIEFAAGGGTNFSKLELLRSDPMRQSIYNALAHVGHTALDMVEMVNQLTDELGDRRICNQLIISGGIKDFLDGHFLCEKAKLPSIYGQASAFLRHATEDYETLRTFVSAQIRGLELARTYLKVR